MFEMVITSSYDIYLNETIFYLFFTILHAHIYYTSVFIVPEVCSCDFWQTRIVDGTINLGKNKKTFKNNRSRWFAKVGLSKINSNWYKVPNGNIRNTIDNNFSNIYICIFNFLQCILKEYMAEYLREDFGISDWTQHHKLSWVGLKFEGVL